MEFITIDKTRCLGILEDELGQMMEIRLDLKTQIILSASKAMDLSEVGPDVEPKPEVVIVDKDLSGYMTIPEIKAALDKLEVKYNKKASRAELLDLLEAV